MGTSAQARLATDSREPLRSVLPLLWTRSWYYLDEPGAGLSPEETRSIVKLIRDVTAGKTLVIVEHDMSVVFDLSDRISVLTYGTILSSGTPEEIRNDAAVREAYLGNLGREPVSKMA